MSAVPCLLVQFNTCSASTEKHYTFPSHPSLLDQFLMRSLEIWTSSKKNVPIKTLRLVKWTHLLALIAAEIPMTGRYTSFWRESGRLRMQSGHNERREEILKAAAPSAFAKSAQAFRHHFCKSSSKATLCVYAI